MSEETKFTPGPWEIKGAESTGPQIWATVNIGPDENGGVLQPIYECSIKPQVMVGNNGQVCACISYESWRQFPSQNFKEMQIANATLIKAAPDLYAGCAEALHLLGLGDIRTNERIKAITLLKSALAKATHPERRE